MVELIDSPLIKCLVAMLETELDQHNAQKELDANSYIKLELPELGLIDKVLSIVGLPEDNSLEYTEVFDNQSGDLTGCFCRDAFFFKWGEVEDGKMTIREFIKWIIAESAIKSWE